MRGLIGSIIGASFALAVVACGHSGADDLGRLTLERTAPNPAHLGTMPARALYCSRDTMLTIVTEGGAWSTAIAVRTEWPPISHAPITSPPPVVGAAVAAVRSVGDSVRTALTATDGNVTIESGVPISGHFTIDMGRDLLVPHLKGTFERLRVDTAGCVAG
ncbi:MAG TPA: hypothetical protein VGI92_09875 [Gemmatimonadales bacterium]|jgi:hypothetical protein